MTLVFTSSQFLQAVRNTSLRLGLGLLNVLYCVMLPMGLIGALYFISIFSKLFQITKFNISLGMLLAYVRGVGSVTPILRERVAHLADRLPAATRPLWA